ncbi:MAG TPA: hypothetical protein VK920_06600 [Solirubrobacterales bacterium]|nr:hypothetical protein [Solirubrobacterales bacterium]
MASDSFQPNACDVCGRHMLPGESAREYVTADRDRRAVCDLCRGWAERAGWVRADRVRDEEAPADPNRRPRRRWIVERISQRRARRREEMEEPEEAEERPAPQRKPSAPTNKAPRRPGAAEPPERRIRRALDRFNRSEHRRTVEGLTRSLGSPRVAAVTPAEAPDQVRLTVAWELSWYQWKVEFGDDDAAVRALRNGKEVSELGPADRAWNARAGEDGRIQLRVGSNGDGEVLVPDDLG